MGDDVYTTKQLVSGEMQAAYEASRGPYKKYETAFHAFSEASSRFRKDQELDGVDGFTSRAKDIAAMDSAEKAMREASGEYQILCAKLGIETSAKRLDTLASHIVQGSNELGDRGDAGPARGRAGLGELKSALKGAEGMGVKKLEQEAAEAVAKSVVKEGEALAVGLEAEARTGMPVKNQKAIADSAEAHDVVIDVRGTNPEAPRRLAEGNLPKPEAIKAKSINQLDTYIGFRREDVGLVGDMEPKPPVKGEVPPELWEQVQKRYADRLAEFKDLAPEMQNLGRPVGARDQFAAVGLRQAGDRRRERRDPHRRGRGQGGHRLHRRPRHLPDHQPQRHAGVAAEVQRSHDRPRPAGRRGRARRAHGLGRPQQAGEFRLQGPDQGLPGDRGQAHAGRQGRGGPLPVRPRRSITPVRADPAKDTLGSARAAGKASKGAAVPDIDKTVQGIGPQ